MKIESNRLDYFSNYICLTLLAIASCLVVLLWNDIPSLVAISYGFNGNVNSYGDKYMVVVILLLNWFVFVLMSVLQNYPKTWNMGFKITKHNEKRLYRLMKDMMNMIKIYICFILTMMIIYMILNASMNIIINIVLIILLIFIVGYYLGQMYFCK